MRRRLYLIALFFVQFVLMFKLAPPLARALAVDLAAGLAPGGWPAMLQLVAAAAAIVGTSLSLVFPGLALARHRRAGDQRFLGLPVWAVALSLGAAATLAVGVIAQTIVPLLPVNMRMTAVLVTRPVIVGALALAIAGVLSAELLRRSVVPARAAAQSAHRRTGRVEVTHPADLRTRTA